MIERISSLLFPFINLIIFVFLLIFFVRKPIKNFLKNRREAVIGHIEESKKIFEQAHAKASVARQKMANIDKEGEAYVASLRADAQYLAKRLVEEAQEKTQMVQKEVSLIIEAEEEQVEKEFKTNFITKIIRTAHRDMEKNLSPEDSDKFIKDIKA